MQRLGTDSGLSPQPSGRLLPGAWWVWCSCSASRVKSWLQAPKQLLLDCSGLPARLGHSPRPAL